MINVSLIIVFYLFYISKHELAFLYIMLLVKINFLDHYYYSHCCFVLLVLFFSFNILFYLYFGYEKKQNNKSIQVYLSFNNNFTRCILLSIRVNSLFSFLYFIYIQFSLLYLYVNEFITSVFVQIRYIY